MKETIKLFCVLTALTLWMTACGGGAANNANTAKPANAANNATNSSNANKSNTTSKADTKPKTEIKDEKASKPSGDTKKQKNAPTVPAEWVYYADEAKGYGFSLPKGSNGDSSNEGGVDTFVASTPDDITVIVYAFKDSTLSKEDLLERAEKALGAMGETVTAGELKGESEDYAVADASSESKDGSKSKLKVLVATDVSDNYVMFVRSDAASYDAKKATMDMIWGSFEMYSGGASAN
ncbi:MAG: hypothetical protein WA584_03370 [Pyrinomonadaceae bacterium]